MRWCVLAWVAMVLAGGCASGGQEQGLLTPPTLVGTNDPAFETAAPLPAVDLEQLIGQRLLITEVETDGEVFTPVIATTEPHVEISESQVQINAGGCNDLTFSRYTYRDSRLELDEGVRTQVGGCVPMEQEDLLFGMFLSGIVEVSSPSVGVFVLKGDTGSVVLST